MGYTCPLVVTKLFMNALYRNRTKPRSLGGLDIGHGSITGMRFNNRLVFFAQVSKRSVKLCRSNNICLFLLPCPQPWFSALCDCTDFVKPFSLLRGDIESIPRPDTAFIMEQLRALSRDLQDSKETGNARSVDGLL